MGGRVETEGGCPIEAVGRKYGCGEGAVSGGPAASAASAAGVFKPGIAAGVSLSALAGMALGAGGMPQASDAALCLTCIMLAAMGSGGVNSVLDARMDAVMPRVGARVMALGRLGVTPVIASSSALAGVSLMLAYRSFGLVTAALILAAVLSYTVLYTLYLKRRSPYGTVPGGLPGALPVLIGYSAASPSIGIDGFLLFAVMLLWQPPHFLALALKYKDEYARAGVPVMPVVLGERFTVAFTFIYMTALVPAGMSLWFFGGASGHFAVLACLLGLSYVGVSYLSVVRSRRYGRAFAASIVYIMALLSGLILDTGLLCFSQ